MGNSPDREGYSSANICICGTDKGSQVLHIYYISYGSILAYALRILCILHNIREQPCAACIGGFCMAISQAYFLSSECTVREFAERYLEDHCRQKDSWRDDFRRMKKKILPVLGDLKLKEVRRSQIDYLHRTLRNAPYDANRTLELIQRMFQLAVHWEVLPETHGNPARLVEPFPEFPRDVWIKQDKMPTVLEHIHQLKENTYRVAILMLLATGCRQDELFKLKWSEVDFKSGQIHIRRKDTKTEQAHMVPITPYIKELLESLRRENEYVFPSRSSAKGHLTTISGTWASLRKRAGISEVQLRDLRSTAASWCANANVSLYTIQKMLNHTTPRCTQRYAKLQNEPVRLALERYHESLNPSA